ncbi:Deoxyhypusine hydroxylase [Wickerhamiella sorbophila]|uniref:Deoxyhypusine hydroxylase n=1 Tax=Wickerhamiella sorbophila TaxID=45607 RepID=A0A2T0FE69_9ASCO|nr:Deoxyhypusine hydroxylase [Wickerhamiella sorbophila]PRT53298.1 Deoxyhypusine hydroxylase [Wickerhamiella sorbophila]
MDTLRQADGNEDLQLLKDHLLNKSGDVDMAHRFRALFHLKSLGAEGNQEAIDIIAEGFKDPSELLKHEMAYCLGQTKQKYALKPLEDVLKDLDQQAMVRHEAAEALGAIGDSEALDILKYYYEHDPLEVVRQTCELAIARIHWEQSDAPNSEELQKSQFSSIDPAPPLPIDSCLKVAELKEILLNQDESLFVRYRAMFRLRDIGTEEAVLALADGFKDPSALFRHEIAYVFGQLCDPVSVPALVEVLQNPNEEGMVRHEAAEALGSVATEDVLPILRKFAQDQERVVRESAEVALDMYEYENSNEIEYAAIKTE